MLLARGLDLFDAALRRLCQACRRAVDNCSIMFMLAPLSDGAYSEVSIRPDNGEDWRHYCKRIMEMAPLFNAAVIDLDGYFSEQGVTKGYQLQIDFHLTDQGHQVVTDLIAPVIV